jgi:hypothetical protein
VDDNYQEFLAAKTIWAKETKGQSPAQKDYPLKIKLNAEATSKKTETKEK